VRRRRRLSSRDPGAFVTVTRVSCYSNGMMTKPKCKLCGAAHWSYEPHILSGDSKRREETFKNLGVAGVPAIAITDGGEIVPLDKDGVGDVTVTLHTCPVCGLRHRGPKYHAQRVDALRSAAGIVIPEEEKEAQRYFLGVLTKMIQHDVNCLAEELR